jgi:TRAP-type C4-dicarboxylate transport system substrate-binding protein
MATRFSRRSVIAGATAVGSTIIVKPTRAADHKFVQYHNQPAGGTLHKNLVAMWDAVRGETNGRAEATVYAENNKIAGGDPEALKKLLTGEIQFFTLMGGIIGTVVPVAEAQQVPFAFKSAPEAHKVIDGPFGRYIGEEMAAKGMYLFPIAGFDNGMRQVTTVNRPIAKPDDFAGMKIRVPPGQMIFDTFAAFGAQPVTTPANQIYDALKSGKVEGAGESARDHAGIQARRDGEVCKHDQPYVVGLQPDGGLEHVDGATRRDQGGYRKQRRKICAPAARGAGQAQCRPAGHFCRARNRVQRGRPGGIPCAPSRCLCDLEGQARRQMLELTRGRGGQTGLTGTCRVVISPARGSWTNKRLGQSLASRAEACRKIEDNVET